MVSLALVAKEVAAAALRALAEEAIVNDETRTSVDEKERKAKSPKVRSRSFNLIISLAA